jgi:NAD(P)-dependent dehydrogenase (short-subunit alcohol dehydrogenase family)
MRTRIVVGAAGFIGRAIIEHLASEDDRVIAVDPELFGPNSVRSAADPETIAATVKPLARPGARIELIYAAGTHPPLRAMSDTPANEVARALLDTVDAYAAMRTFAQTVAKSPAAGSIVFISTVGASHPHRYLAGYDAARAAAESIVRSIAVEYGRRGVTARTLAVGPVRESSSTAADGGLAAALVDLVPTGTYASVADIAAVAAALAGPAFDCVNGHTITADGGLTVQLRPSAIERGPDS